MKGKDVTNEISKLHSEVRRLLAENYTDEAIINQLKNQGLEQYYIETIISNISTEIEDKKSFRNSMIMGLFYITAGLVVNFLSYRIAENGKSSFFYLFWGVVVLGIVTIARGFILYKN